jgi:ATP-dependent RNA helicase DDX27
MAVRILWPTILNEQTALVAGKTASFMLPVLERLLYRPKNNPTTRVLVLSPTRELAAQCHAVGTKLAQFTDITFSLIVGM